MSQSDDWREHILGRVMDAGHVIQYVTMDGASAMDLSQPYAYTLGRTMFGRPEFFVTGLPPEVAEPLLNELVRMDDGRATSSERPPAEHMDGLYPTVDLGHTRLTVKLLHADASLLLGTQLTFGVGKVTALQALWPRNGRYPSEEDLWSDQPIRPYALLRKDPYV